MKFYDEDLIKDNIDIILRKNNKSIRCELTNIGLENFAEPKFDFRAFRIINKEGEGFIRVSFNREIKHASFDIISEETLNYLKQMEFTSIVIVDCFDDDAMFLKLVNEEIKKVKQL